ncbi:MAG TPA: carboxymethylenebutenolidase [Microscillaceae bacterium]|nr:carboxymethylenebutenolidase [Microscillaceae bacterium]
MLQAKQSFLFFLLGICALSAKAQDFALAQLNNSPRHHEWAQVVYDNRTVHCFVAYPEKPNKTQAVVVIHENRGLNDWARSFADQLAGEGYLVIAPDLLSGFSADKQRTSDFANSDDARTAISQLNADQITNDLKAVVAFTKQIPSCDGTVSVAGFCFGGSQAFRFATNAGESIKQVMVFYGTAPTDVDALGKIKVPVFGFYGGNDNRVNATIPDTENVLKANGKTYTYTIYEGAGHAFMRLGDDPAGSEENKAAQKASWEKLRQILGE